MPIKLCSDGYNILGFLYFYYHIMQKSNSITDPIKQKQQISLLKELHRPLEGNLEK